MSDPADGAAAPIEVDATVLRFDEAREHAQQRRFPGAIRTEYSEGAAGSQRKRDIIEGPSRAEGVAQSLSA
jgi:hypothetical protein